ncbi:MAG: hypothetical protein FJ197_04215 [Gammaproteobacteria bacterium]|nr:hypothetical protein [Gammaproteobacteria bacterium]
MKRYPSVRFAVLLAALIIAISPGRGSEPAEPVDAARAAAEAVEAALFAPGAYGAGLAARDKAAADAEEKFRQAARQAAVARERFAATLRKREEARSAEAYLLAPQPWARAEAMLGQAAQRLERAAEEAADERAAEALALYDAAELAALKAAVLTAARTKVMELEPSGADRLAPRTSQRARDLLAGAEAELDADRGRQEAAGRLAAESLERARHALALAGWLRSARERDGTAEDTLLAWQESLRRSATASGETLDFSAGPDAASAALATAVAKLRGLATEQAAALAERGRQIQALEEEIRELDARLAAAGSEARSLGERLAERERAIEQFARLEQAFAAGGATVLRQSENIIVRLTGLSFASGSSRLPGSAQQLLDALREAVNIYPRASFALEGHTDSSGDSAANQRLSQSRAEAVRTYMVGTLEVPEGRVTAVGFGDTRPVASNASPDGRGQNRRIDLLIEPRESLTP